jgi:hypothetical protein
MEDVRVWVLAGIIEEDTCVRERSEARRGARSALTRERARKRARSGLMSASEAGAEKS